MHHKLRRPKSVSLSAYTQGPRVDSGRGHLHDPRGHAQPPSPGSRAALFCQPARARRDAARSGATGRVPGGDPCAQDPCPAALPCPGLPAPPSCPARPPRASMATAAPPSRAATMSRNPSSRVTVLTGMVAASRAPPTSPLGMQPNNTGFAGEADRGRPKHLGALETAAYSATEGSAQAHSELAPPNLGHPRLLAVRVRKDFRVHLHGRQTAAAPAQLCRSSGLRSWVPLKQWGHLAS